MQRSLAITACALAFAVAWLAAGPLAAQEEQGEAAQAEKGTEEIQAEEAVEPRRRGRASGSGIWWNNPTIVEELSLAEEQRKKMDGYLDEYRRTEPGEDRRLSFNEALHDGNWGKARSELKQLSDQAAASIRARGELKINVLSTLSDAQRKTLVERYRRLINQPWLRGMRPPGRTAQGARSAEQPTE
jgi:Spy/CpxP family protein refolding chaperone